MTSERAGRQAGQNLMFVSHAWQSPGRLLTVDFGGWGETKACCPNRHTHRKDTQTHTWIMGWYRLGLLRGNKVIQRKCMRKWQGCNHVSVTAAALIRCALLLHLSWILVEGEASITATDEEAYLHVLLSINRQQWLDVFISRLWQTGLLWVINPWVGYCCFSTFCHCGLPLWKLCCWHKMATRCKLLA